MIKATRIEYFVNQAHLASGLPPVYTQIVDLCAADYIALNNLAGPVRQSFRDNFHLPEALGVMNTVTVDERDLATSSVFFARAIP